MSNASDFVIENGVLTKYVGPGGDVVIPEGVKEIRDWAFKIRNDITSVCIPLGVKRIRKYAFFRCSQLSSVNFPDGLETISAGAFEECSSLQFLEISNSVTFIGTMAFANCGMEKVSMPLRTKDDGFRPQGVFFGCKNLRSVSFTTDVDPNYLPLVLSQRSTFDECPLEAIYAPQCPISSMSHYKSYAAAGYAEMVLDGKEIEPEIAITYDRYLKSQRKKLCSFAIVHLPLLRLMLGHKLYSNQEAADCLELALQNGASEAAAVLLEYQRGFTASEKALEENQEIAKALSVPSELELLKSIWTTVLNEDGICVNMYKGAQTEVTIPDKIGRNIVTEIGEFALSPR